MNDQTPGGGSASAGPQQTDYDPNFDWADRVKASVSSLRELIIIFTGITITASFTLFITRHLVPNGIFSHSSIVLINDVSLPSEIAMLVLLILSVMRFYYGNVMILDRYYMLPGTLKEHERRFGLDSLFIVLMTFFLAILGLVVQFPSIFFWVYIIITSLSIFWIFANLKNIMRETGRLAASGGYNPRWQEEAQTQVRWLQINLVFFVVMGGLLLKGGGWNLVAHDGVSDKYLFMMPPWVFWSLLTAGVVNCFVDFVMNHREYFPKYQSAQR